MRIQPRLFVTYLILGIGLAAVAGALLYPRLASEARAVAEARLEATAGMITVELERQGAADSLALDERIDALARAADARITIVARDGRVLADSDFDGAALAALDNHAGRAEVRAAQAGGVGRSVRYSRSVDADLLYHALRVDRGPLAGGVVRVAVPLTRVAAARAHAARVLAVALLVGLAAALAMGALMARRLSGPVRELRATAARVVTGDLSARARVRTGDELQELAESLDQATERLADRIAAATAERDRLEGVVEAMIEGVVVTAPDGRVALANAAVLRLFGVDGALAGRTVLEALRHAEAADALAEAARRRAPVSREIEVTWPAARTLALQAVSLPAGGAVGVFHDVTESRHLDAVRRDFVANVSHELKTPLATLAGHAEELATPGLSPAETARSAEVIGRHVARMAALVEDLLALARLEAKGFAPAREAVDVSALVREAVEEWRPRAGASGIALAVETEAPVSVPADAGLLRRAIDNLLDNVLRHCPAGTTARVGARTLPHAVEITVADDGPGIPAAEQARIFERFYRVEKGRSRERGGTGLGLAIVKHVAEAHGGRASVESRPGTGSLFRVTLPRDV
jgi:two-component system phosphate regulon sensor histidine kinase PhoR